MYHKKHPSKDPQSQKEIFFMKEKQFTIGRKKVTISGKNMSVKLIDVSKIQLDTAVDVIRSSSVEAKYSEQQFRELRESILEL